MVLLMGALGTFAEQGDYPSLEQLEIARREAPWGPHKHLSCWRRGEEGSEPVEGELRAAFPTGKRTEPYGECPASEMLLLGDG